jgi:threonine synthase
MPHGPEFILPAGKIATGKLVQAVAHGARIISIDGNFDDALRIVRELGDKGKFAIVNSINPDRIAGQKTAAFEIVDELGEAPDIHILPLGNAGNLTAYSAGYLEYRQLGKARILPRMIGIQAEHAAPIFHRRVIERPETVASAIRIGNPASWQAAQRAIDESHGAVEIVNDGEILEAQSWLAKTEGIFVEPASAAPIAGLFKLSNTHDLISKNSVVVCTCTGHGLKDPEIISAKFSQGAPVAATLEAVREVVSRS